MALALLGRQGTAANALAVSALCSGLAQLAHAVLGRSRWRVVALWLADLPGVVVGRSACVGVRGGGLLYMSLGSGRLGLLFGCCSAEAH